VLHFPDYTETELIDIARDMFEAEGLLMDSDAEKHFLMLISDMLKKRDEYFGNAREIRKITQTVIRRQNLRLASMESNLRTPQMIATILREDFSNLEMPTSTQNGSIGFKRSEQNPS
jgi:hypothetical protein